MDIVEEIAKVAEAMEKSVETPDDQLFKAIQMLGPEGIREKLFEKSEDGSFLLNDEDRMILKSALEDMKKAQSPAMDANYQSKFHPGKVTDTIIQEDKADDDDDEKLVKESNAQMKHQGDNAPEGFEGQVIKAKKPEKDDEPKEKKLATKMADAVDEMAEDEAKEEVEDHEEKMHKKDMKKSKEELLEMKKSIEDAYKTLDVEPTEELVKAKMKEKLLAEEDQLGNDETEDSPEPRANTKRPKELKTEEDNKEAQDQVNNLNQGKMKKSLGWADENALLKACTNGRNFHFSVNGYYDEALAKAEAIKSEEIKPETLVKSEDELDLNDLIEKSMDTTAEAVACDKLIKANKAKIDGKFAKSFQDNEIAQALGLTEEEAKEILGE